MLQFLGRAFSFNEKIYIKKKLEGKKVLINSFGWIIGSGMIGWQRRVSEQDTLCGP